MKKHMLYTFLFIFILSCGAKKNAYKNYKTPLPELITSLKISIKDISILIDKSDYKLSLIKDTLVIKEYPVVFGGNPVDDKLKQGDQCTPEGTFKMRSKYPHKSWSKFIWIDYPNTESWKKHNEAKKHGLIPKDAKIGGEIGIHGVPKGLDNLIDIKYNWTLGCISLKNKDINEIYPCVNESTIITIRR